MRFRRKSAPVAGAPADTVLDEHETRSPGDAAPDAARDAAEAGEQRPEPRAFGPWDVQEKPVDEDDPARVHLGSLSVAGHPEVDLRLHVDEASGEVAAVLLVGSDGAMEVRAFAAPRNEDLWDEIRPQLAADAERRGGRVQEVAGPFGPALHLVVPAVAPDGSSGEQPSTVLGISGPRWLLRVSMFGRPAREYRPNEPLESVLRSIVVVRGTAPMAPGDALPLHLPATARRIDPMTPPPGPADGAADGSADGAAAAPADAPDAPAGS